MADDKPTSTDGPKNWRGSAASANQTEPRYGWQSDEREAAPLHARRGSLKRRFKILGFGIAVLAITALFLTELLFSQLRTPIIVFAPADYEFPFQPLSWSQEDLEGLRELDRETLNLLGMDASWKTKDQGLRQFDTQLQGILRQSNLPATVVLYLRMHSAVDGNGVPCVVPPGSNPFNADSWIPIKDVLQRFRLQNIPDRMRKLVILDCSSVLCDWSQGVVFNTFAARLPAAVTEAGIPNLAVISAAGPAEVSATSTELRHGVFGHFLERGLAGAADKETGNRDRLVSVRELHLYLLNNVNAWSQKNRARPQRPQLIPADADDFSISTVFNPSARKHANIESRLAANTAATVSAAEVTALWKKFEDCQKLNPFRFDPVAWTDFEQRLRWLEMALDSGEGYSRTARRIYRELQQRVTAADQLGDEAISARNQLSRWATFSAEPLLRYSTAKLNTLPLAELFGTMGRSSVENGQAILSQFKKGPSVSSLHDAIQALSGNVDLSQLELTCLLQLWQRYDVLRLWADTSVLTDVIELHELGESAAAPADERVLDWIRPVIESADLLRRQVDDRVLLGGTAPSEQIVEARKLYDQSIRIAAEVTRAYEVRDRVDHQLPYFAQWLLRPRYDGPAATPSFLESKTTILEIMRNQRALERALSQPAITAHGDLLQLPFQGLLINAQTEFDRILGLFAGEYERLLQTDDSSAATWNDIHDLLAVPLLPPWSERLALKPSQQRNLLQEKLTTIERKLVDRFAESARSPARNSTGVGHSESGGGGAGHQRAETSHLAEFLDELLIEVPENLGLAIVRREQNYDVDESQPANNSENNSANHDIETIAEMQGRLFRAWMKSVPETIQTDTEEQLTSSESRVFQNCLAEKLARACATVAPNRQDNDPIVLRRQSDLQGLLLWHGRRVMEDFWGRCSLEESSFFDVTATNLMKLSESIGKTTMSSQTEVSELNLRLKRYRAAAADGLTTVSDNLLIADDAEPAVAKIAVYPCSRQDCQFPSGIASVFVLNPAGARLGESHSFLIPSTAATVAHSPAAQFTVRLDGVDHRTEPVALRAVTTFRGHDFSGDLTVNSIAGKVVDYQPNIEREARISIRGRRTRKLSIVFVLDCSNSMSQQLSLTGDNQSGSRLQLAKLALQSMLDRMAEDETHRVGVICFGHRIGWDIKQPGLYLRQTEYNAPIPDQVRPYDDVETILPLGRFNASFAGAVADRLESIKPWGESPIYLAIIQALKMFDNDEQDSDRCVVVVTDGTNYQFNAPAPARKSVYDVLSTWNDHKVPINIVGLGIGADQAAVAQREFGDLAKKTNGTYVSAQEARTLVESLAALQRISDFRVRGLLRGELQQAELGQPITVEVDPHQLNPFEVTLGPATEQVALRGGEGLELVPTRDDRRLDVQAYEVGQPRFVSLVQDDKRNSATDLQAGFHRPFRRGQKVTFEISIQHRQRHFVARPREAWIEIVPLQRQGQASSGTYLFYDANYVPNMTAPVLRWTVNDWPADAVQAKIRFWCRPDDSKPTTVIPLARIMDASLDPDFPLEGVAGVNSRIRVARGGQLQISFVERHSTESAGVGSLKVSLNSTAFPVRVRHRFDAGNLVATHFFEFPANQDGVLKDGEFVITTRTAALAGAWRTPEAVVVDVTETGDVHD